MRRSLVVGLSLLLLCSLIWVQKPVTVSAYTTENYDWDNVRIGGGGAIPGIVLHPLVQDVAYVRTDVGALYRWDAANECWHPLTEWIDFGEGVQRLYGVEAVAVDPSDATGNIVYASIGKNPLSGSVKGEVIKSTDRGETWTRTGHRTWTASNWDQEYGEKLAVDPNNGNVVYHASREGLYRSMDGGSTWAKLPSPTGDTSNVNTNTNDGTSGITFVAIDPGPTIGTPARSAVVYVGAYNDGIYRSMDGGDTYTKLAGGPSFYYRAEAASDGTLYVTGEGVWKYDGTIWDDISPQSGLRYMALGVDPEDSDHLIVSKTTAGTKENAHNLPMWRSTDGGVNWTELSMNKNKTTPWMPDHHWRSSTFDIAIDPFDEYKVWYTDWYSPWRTDDVKEFPASKWTDYNTGIEELVTTGGLISPAAGEVKLISAVADNGGFAHTSLTNKPEASFWERGAPWENGTGLDFQESAPNFVVLSTIEGWDGGEYKRGSFYYSTDYGLHFTKGGALPVAEARGGRVAVSATSERTLWTVAGKGTYVTTDRGNSWTQSNGLPNGLVILDTRGIFQFNQPLASDRVDGDTFYAYQGGTFYRSTDGGLNFTNVSSLPSHTWHFVQAAPGIEGEVWVSLDHQGLYRSSNGGTTFTKMSGIQRAHLFTFGKGLTPSTPSVYVYGTLLDGDEEVTGIFRSDDLGASWVKIDVPDPTAGNEPNIMAGDRQVHGRVYIGTNGSGIYYGQPAGFGDTVPPTAPANLQLDSKTENSVTLTWSASTDNVGVSGYDVYRDSVKVNTSLIPGTTYTVDELSPSTTYTFTVKAVDVESNESAASAPLGVTTDAATGSVFFRGINMNGGAVTIDGNAWMSDTAAGVSFSTVNTWTASSPITLVPTVDNDTKLMLHSSVYHSNSFSVSQPIPNGTYFIYLWMVENYMDNFRSFDVKLEGVKKTTSPIGESIKYHWMRYGPFEVTVTDGTLDMELVKVTGDPMIMGMEMYQ